MDKKYFFFDIDGTLTDRKTGEIVPSAQKALDQLQAAGHFVAIATGRAHYKSIDFMRSVGLKNMVCAGGGALVLDNQLIHNQPLDLVDAKKLLAQAEALNLGTLLMLDDSIKVYAKNDLFREQVGERREPTEYFIDETLDYDNLTEIYKIYVAISEADEAQLTTKDALGYVRFMRDYLTIQYDDKYSGILATIKHLKGDLSEVVVFGDDTNDLVMFSPEWTSIAMGNAHPDLKEKADFVTAKNVDDGIYKACQKFGWI